MKWLKNKLAKLFEPAWKSNNLRRALAAVNRISDDKKLYEIATTYRVPEEIKLAAIKKMNDQDLIAQLARGSDYSAASAALDRLTDQRLLMWVAMRPNPYRKQICQLAVQKITDQAILAEIAMSNSPHVADAIEGIAVDRITDQALLLQVAQHQYTQVYVCKHALEKLQDPAAVIALAVQGNETALGMLANDQAALARAAEETQYASVRLKIAELLQDAEVAQRGYKKVAMDTAADPHLRMTAGKKIGDQNLVAMALKDLIVGSPDPMAVCWREMQIEDCARLILMPEVSDIIVTYVLQKSSWYEYHSLLKMLDDIPTLERLANQAERSKTDSEEYRPADDPLAYGASRTTYTFPPESVRQAAMDRVKQLRGDGMLQELRGYPHTTETKLI